MIGEMGWFPTIFGSTPTGDVTHNRAVARAAIQAGLAIVILHPGKKLPMCTLSTAQRTKADKEAQAAAKANGSAHWDRVQHDCGSNHALTNIAGLNRTVVKAALDSGANLAVSIAHSSRHVIVVDVDTPRQYEAFMSTWSPDGGGQDHPLTVTSPGTKDDAGQWLHTGGGHIWFDAPDTWSPPGGPGKYTSPDGWCAYFGSGYLLVPPSVRDEGPYRCTGDSYPAPSWLLEAVAGTHSAGKELKHSSSIDEWSAEISWDELLTADGFTPCAHDACGCPTFTRPGSPAHSKSVTAHETGCPRYDTSQGHGPLHVWSDALRDTIGTTCSKLSFYARTWHGGDTGKAMRALGLASEITPAKTFDEFPGTASPKALTAYQRRLRAALKSP